MEKQRTRYLIAYDISDAKRLSRTHKKVESYAIGGQKSFYECWLAPQEYRQFKQELTDIIEPNEDHISIFQLHSDTEPLLFGKAKLQVEPFLII